MVGADAVPKKLGNSSFQISDIVASVQTASHSGVTNSVPLLFPDAGFKELTIDQISLSWSNNAASSGKEAGGSVKITAVIDGEEKTLYSYRRSSSSSTATMNNISIDISGATKVMLYVTTYCHNDARISKINGITFS